MTLIANNNGANVYSLASKPAMQAGKASNSTASPNATATTIVRSSTDKTFSQVILNARASIDTGYQKLGKFADDSTTGKEWNKTIGWTVLIGEHFMQFTVIRAAYFLKPKWMQPNSP